MDLPYAIKFISIPGAFLIAGYNFTFSQNGVPHLYSQPPSVSAPIFAKIYYSGLHILAPMITTTAGAFGYLAYTSQTTQRKLYGTSAVLLLGIGAWTRLIMLPGIERLIEISKDESAHTKASTKDEVNGLIKAWTVQNWFRGSLGFAAGMLGLYASLP